MSLILDALNRSREDANPVPGLTTHHPVEQVAVNRRQYLLWVALSVAVVVIAWLFVERYSAPQPAREIDIRTETTAAVSDGGAPDVTEQVRDIAVVAEQVAPPVVESAPPMSDTLIPESAIQAAESRAASAQMQALESLDEGLSAAMEQQKAAAAAVRSEPVPTRSPPADDAVAQLYENPDLAEEPVLRNPPRQASASSKSTEAPIDVDKMIKLAQEEAKNVGLSEHSVPLLIDMSQQFKDTVPTVYYLRHDYSSDTSRSTVVLNSKTLSVGGSAAVGLKVEEILPDSVVLNYQGTQFRLSALNSWINL